MIFSGLQLPHISVLAFTYFKEIQQKKDLSFGKCLTSYPKLPLATSSLHEFAVLWSPTPLAIS